MTDDTNMTHGPNGLERLRALMVNLGHSGTMLRTLNMSLVSAEADHVVFRGAPTAEHMNPFGSVHGGWASTILDSALGCATQIALAPGEVFTTLELKVNLIRALQPDGPPLTATGRLINRGRRTAITEATLTDDAGKVYAHGVSTCMIMQDA